MSHYQPASPRALIGIAAFAFSALTIAATVVLPASASPSRLDAAALVSECGPATLMAAPADFRQRLDVAGTSRPGVEAADAAEPTASRARHG
jgi:hypothetical protein